MFIPVLSSLLELLLLLGVPLRYFTFIIVRSIIYFCPTTTYVSSTRLQDDDKLINVTINVRTTVIKKKGNQNYKTFAM